MPTSTTDRRHPLILTADPILLDDLLRLAAAGSAEVRVANDVVAARADWVGAPLVVLGLDAASDVVRANLPRRPAVILVADPGSEEAAWRWAGVLGPEHVVVLPEAESWLVDRFADLVLGSPTRGRVLAVLGGRGGAGASVLATALAVTGRRRGLDTLLVDADPLGSGSDVVLGWERRPGLRWPDLLQAQGLVDPPALVNALPRDGSLAVLSFDRTVLSGVPVAAMAAALDAGRRGRDLVVIDLPRTFDESSLLALAGADRGYLVVPAEIQACASARRIAATATTHCGLLSLVVRVGPAHGLAASDVAHRLALPLAGTLKSEPRVVRALANGHPPGANGQGALADLCRTLLADLTPRRHRAAVR